MAFQCESSQRCGVTVARMTGDIDGSTAAQAQADILPLIEPGVRLVLDMEGLAFMSSAGLRTMLLIYRQAASANGTVALAGLPEQIRDTMSITGFLTFFTVCATVEEAATAIGGGC